MKSSWARPNPSDADVTALNRINNLAGVPVVLAYLDQSYLPAFCHISAKHQATIKGGRRVHGWSYWRLTDLDEVSGQSNHLMMAEHHSVWETESGELIDVTPPRYGGNTTLFLRDDAAIIVCTLGEIPVRTNLADLQSGVFLRDAQPVSYSSYLLSEADAGRAWQYAEELGFDMTNYATDQQRG
ncbi:hypothetical protein ELH81_15740 [Rhizobium leguminosarum]|uniref:hypothetical protein n=1 Tax=Rhizobium leguminosarum TaxID=384 RepID=UPI00102F99E4|nr:hypothetical protein [Rhizobium leguminosarum]TAZ15423.1 hypothetical protein ELH81_15740 [Rhizobium leguminosarum]